MTPDRFASDVIVVGSGPAGLTAALAIAGAGLSAVLVGPRPEPDNRTTALLASSISALETLGVWAQARDFSAPLRRLRIIDDTSRLIRAPEALFEASEIGLEAFAHNIENVHLVAALEAKVAGTPGLRRIEETAATVTISDAYVTVRTASGVEIKGKLAVGADGAHSLCRAAAGIEMRSQRYPQIALTFNVGHTRPHRDTSTEFHTELGPFTTVPLPGLRSSIVCVVNESEAGFLQDLPEEALNRELERRSHSILGKMAAEPRHGRFPLAAETAQRFGANRIALIGEAGHRIPPIGAQGLNLGLRDAAAIAEVVAGHRDDPGAPQALDRYETLRRADVSSRTMAVDLLNRSLLSGFLPIQGMRSFGLHLLNTVGPLRRAVMREGVMPRASQPRLMRGESLR